MTNERTFKNKVKELASINDLSYTQAKKIAIKFKELEKEENLFEIINAKSLFTEVPDDSLSIQLRDNSYIQLNEDYVNNFIKISPIKEVNRPFYHIRYSNIEKGRIFVSHRDRDAKTIFYRWVDKYFGVENSYFVDNQNYVQQLARTINVLEKRTDRKPTLIGVIAPNPENLTQVQVDLIEELHTKISSFIREDKSLYFVVNEFVKIDEELNDVELLIDWLGYTSVEQSVYRSKMSNAIYSLLRILDKRDYIKNLDLNGSDLEKLITLINNDKYYQIIMDNEKEFDSIRSSWKELRSILKDELCFNKLQKALRENTLRVRAIKFYGVAESEERLVKYYPYDKVHGGSYYKTTNKKVIGHIDGNPQFFNNNFVFLESNGDEKMIENIAELNNSKVVVINNEAEFNGAVGEVEFSGDGESPIFVKIKYAMSDESLEYLTNIISSRYSELKKKNNDKKLNKYDLAIVIQSEQLEVVYSLLTERHTEPEDENVFKMFVNIDDFIYDDESGKITLYNV